MVRELSVRVRGSIGNLETHPIFIINNNMANLPNRTSVQQCRMSGWDGHMNSEHCWKWHRQARSEEQALSNIAQDREWIENEGWWFVWENLGFLAETEVMIGKIQPEPRSNEDCDRSWLRLTCRIYESVYCNHCMVTFLQTTGNVFLGYSAGLKKYMRGKINLTGGGRVAGAEPSWLQRPLNHNLLS